jgi:O-antigen/teichoic acid export membrane protein
MHFQKLLRQSLIWRGLFFLSLLLMNVVLSRYFKASGTGWIYYLSNFFTFIILVAGLSMESGVTYFASRLEIPPSRLAFFCFVWTVVVSLIVFVVLAIYFGRIRDESTLTRNQYLYFAMCYITGIMLTNFFTFLFYAAQDYFLPNVILVAINVFLMIYIGNAKSNDPLAVSKVLHVYFLSFIVQGVLLVMAYTLSHKAYQDIALPSKHQLKQLFNYSMVALVANFIFFLVYRVDYWFVKKYCLPADLGNYIQVSKLGQMLLIIPTIISSVVFPQTAEGMFNEEMKKNIIRIGKFGTLVYIIILFVVVVWGEWLFPFVFGESFYNMYVPFILLMPGLWALNNLFVLSAYFGGTNNIKVNVWGAALGLLFILVGDMLFIPTYGIVAAAIVSSVGYFINFYFSFYHLQKEYKVRFIAYFQIQKEDIQWLFSVIKK